ncbi:hypothetical protein ABEB36_013812 [Hypothenemus hampei]|uniref:Odorant receptor n=1 Tax=Hypothenemus hampei TaxID=57062 RepID=A0ABD1E5N0_HYPHA
MEKPTISIWEKNIIQMNLHPSLCILILITFMLKKIYEESLHSYILTVKILIVLFSITCFDHILKPFYTYEHHQSDGTIVIKRNLMLNSWFPYDTKTHFWKTYILQSFWALALGSGIFFSYFVVFCLFFYAIAQLRIINYIMNNFKTYQSKIAFKELQIDSAESMFKFCIEKHQHIIKFIGNVNKALGLVILVDFLQNSIQMTCILVQILESDDFSFAVILYEANFIVLIICRLCVLYYNGNKITLLSELLANTAYQLNWYDESQRFKFMLNMFLLRCRKPLFIKMGPFGSIGLPAIISVLKATYSYVMLIINKSQE